MKTKALLFVILLLSIVFFVHSQTIENVEIQQEAKSEGKVYRLYPTKNFWTFLKLDTRNGKMWQVHFSIDDDDSRGELILNSLPLVNEAEEVAGRFTLYSTENMYNFLLLDQVAGHVYQIQWSMKSKNRGIIDQIK